MKEGLKVLGIALAFGLVACGGGGGGGGAPSYSALKSKFENPTGDLEAGNAKSVAAALKEEQQSAQGMGQLGLSSVQGAQYDEPIDCSDVTPGSTSVTCTCNGGGTVEFEVGSMTSMPKEGDPIAIGYQYNDCKMEEAGCTSVVDGTGWLLYTYPEAQEYCYSFNGNVSDCGDEVEKVSIEFCYLDGDLWYLVEVGNEYFAVKGTVYDNGGFDIYVKDKDGEWHCTSSDGNTGTCEGPGGTFTFGDNGGEDTNPPEQPEK